MASTISNSTHSYTSADLPGNGLLGPDPDLGRARADRPKIEPFKGEVQTETAPWREPTTTTIFGVRINDPLGGLPTANDFVEAYRNAKETIVGGVTTAVKTGKRAWDRVTGALSTGVTTIGAVAKNAWDTATKSVSGGWESITDTVSGSWSSISDAVSGGWDSVTDAVSDGWSSVKDTISDAWDGLTGSRGGDNGGGDSNSERADRNDPSSGGTNASHSDRNSQEDGGALL